MGLVGHVWEFAVALQTKSKNQQGEVVTLGVCKINVTSRLDILRKKDKDEKARNKAGKEILDMQRCTASTYIPFRSFSCTPPP